MANQPTFGKLEFRLGEVGGDAEAAPEPDAPFLIAVLGDFSGRANRGIAETGAGLAERAIRLVDRDNLDELIGRLEPALAIELGGEASRRIGLTFSELDDFHPDQIYRHMELFQSLRSLRKRLADPATFREAAAELGSSSAPAETASPKPVQPAAPPGGERPAPEGLLDEILEQAQHDPMVQRAAAGQGDWAAMVREIVEPYLVPGRDPRQGELLADLDEATAREMRALLHQPDFQALEAAWRGLDLLTRRLETGTELKIYLVDVSKAELEADLNAADDLSATAVYRLLVERSVGTPGADPWALLVGNYTFGASVEDAQLLGRLAKIARAAGAPWLSAAAPSLIGCDGLAETPDPDDWRRSTPEDVQDAWSALRRLPAAPYVGLVLPRLLLRLPYGSDSDPTEAFAFEELPDAPPLHESYLWGNPAVAAACLIGQGFTARRWQLLPGMMSRLEGLPVHMYKSDGETHLTPCAEALLSDRAAETIATHGIMPLRSVKSTDSVILTPIVSLAEPARALSGRWA